MENLQIRYDNAILALKWFHILEDSYICKDIDTLLRLSLQDRYADVVQRYKTHFKNNPELYDINVQTESILNDMELLYSDLLSYVKCIPELPDSIKSENECHLCFNTIKIGVVQCHVRDTHFWCFDCAHKYKCAQSNMKKSKLACPFCRTCNNNLYKVYKV